MVLLAKTDLSTAEIAQYELFWFLAAMFTSFWVGGSINAALSYLPRFSAQEQKVSLFNLCCLFIGFSAIVSGLFFLLGSWLLTTFTSFETFNFTGWL